MQLGFFCVLLAPRSNPASLSLFVGVLLLGLVAPHGLQAQMAHDPNIEHRQGGESSPPCELIVIGRGSVSMNDHRRYESH